MWKIKHFSSFQQSTKINENGSFFLLMDLFLCIERVENICNTNCICVVPLVVLLMYNQIYAWFVYLFSTQFLTVHYMGPTHDQRILISWLEVKRIAVYNWKLILRIFHGFNQIQAGDCGEWLHHMWSWLRWDNRLCIYRRRYHTIGWHCSSLVSWTICT